MVRTILLDLLLARNWKISTVHTRLTRPIKRKYNEKHKQPQCNLNNKTCVPSINDPLGQTHRPTDPPIAITILYWKLFCFARFWKVTYKRTDNTCENSDHYRPWLRVGLVDQCQSGFAFNVAYLANLFLADLAIMTLITKVHWIDPLSQSTVMAGSDHCFRTCCPSVRPFVRPPVPTFQIQQNKTTENNGRYCRDCGSGRVDHWWPRSCLSLFFLHLQLIRSTSLRYACVMIKLYLAFIRYIV